MNCTELDDALDIVAQFVVDEDIGFIVTLSLSLLTSTVLLIWGEHLVKPLSALVSGVGGCVAVFVVSELFDWSCIPRLAVSVATGICLALLALCLFKTGLVLLGAAGFGTIAHFLYTSLPLNEIKPPFTLAGLSAYYYLALMTATILGGVVAFFQKKNLIRVSSSLIGGAGIATSVHFVSHRTGNTLSPIPLLVVFAISSSVGIVSQRFLSRRRRQQKHTKYMRNDLIRA